jgi:solute carrier family 45 protein 1/2/4
MANRSSIPSLSKDLEKNFDARLLSPHRSESINDATTRPRASTLTLLAISMPRMAIRMAWSAQWAALGPYLQTLLPKYAVQLAQVIGPLSGIIVGPTIGVFSDRCTSKWGRRRPFLAFAALGSVVCWTLMGYTREIGDALGDVGSGKPGEKTDRTWTTVFTIIFYLWMDITVNVVQTPTYLMIADFAGDRQTTGSAMGQGWATLGAILVAGYIQIFGAAHKSLHWFLGMLSIAMTVTVTVACIVGKETPLDVNEKDADPSTSSTWAGVKSAFASIWTGLRNLPPVLVVYAVIFFFNQYGFSAYNGSKGQFFGIEVFDGSPVNAATCADECTEAQKDYNTGVKLAGGLTDILFNSVGYVYSWVLPHLVLRFGAKWVLTIATIPQALLMVMAFSGIVELDVAIVVLTSITLGTVFALIVPLIIHVFGHDVDIGMYVGALNSANCFGQLLNFIVGAALVETSLGYKLPVFIGGAMSFLGFLVGWLLFKVEMYSL